MNATRYPIFPTFRTAGILLGFLSMMILTAGAAPVAVSVQNATAAAGVVVDLEIQSQAALGRLTSFDLTLRYDPQILEAIGSSSRFATVYSHNDSKRGILRTLQTLARGVNIVGATTLLTVQFRIRATTPAGATSEIALLHDDVGRYDFLGPFNRGAASRVSYQQQPGGFLIEGAMGNLPPTLTVTPTQAQLPVGGLAEGAAKTCNVPSIRKRPIKKATATRELCPMNVRMDFIM